MSQYDPKFDLKINIGHCGLYLCSSDFGLHLEDYLMYEHHTPAPGYNTGIRSHVTDRVS